MTGFYAVVMNVGAAVAAGISYPILSSNIGGEKFSTGLAVNIWLILAVINIFVYTAMSKNSSLSAKIGTINVDGNCANWLIDNNNPAVSGVKPLLIIISENQETLQ